jgi:hypothetical protein
LLSARMERKLGTLIQRTRRAKSLVGVISSPTGCCDQIGD